MAGDARLSELKRHAGVLDQMIFEAKMLLAEATWDEEEFLYPHPIPAHRVDKRRIALEVAAYILDTEIDRERGRLDQDNNN